MHAPPRRHGPRSYPLYFSDSGLSQGKTLVFPQLKQFLALLLCCLMTFYKMKKFLLILLSTIFHKPWMFLLFLCLGTILAPSCPASCQPSSSPPPLSGSVMVAWSHLSSRSKTSCAVAPALSPSESGHRARSLLSAASRPAQQQTPSLAASVTTADHWVCAQAVLPQPSGSRFSDPLVSLPSPLAPPRDRPGTVSLPGEEVFACVGLAAPLQVLQTR
jgi:hypothetical protein